MIEHGERRNTFYTDIYRINRSFGAYKTIHRMPPLKGDENPRDVFSNSSTLLQAPKPVKYEAFAQAAPFVWTDETLQEIQTRIGSHAHLPAFDISDPGDSVVKVTVAMSEIVADTVRASLDPHYALAVKKERKSKYIALHPELLVVDEMLGGAFDGSDIMAEVFKAILRNDPFPEPEKIRKILSQSYQAIASMTALNIVPQTIIEGVMAYGIPIFTIDDSPSAPELLSLDRKVVNYVITLGERIFTDGTSDDLSSSGFKEILTYTQREYFPFIPDSLIEDISLWFALSDEDVSKHMQWYPQTMHKELKRYFLLSRKVYREFETILQNPSDLETVLCPATHAKILKPWHTMWVHLLSNWYDKEYERIMSE